jgi:hypothetical protein
MNSLTPIDRKSWLLKLTRNFLDFGLAESLREAFRIAKECVKEDSSFTDEWTAFEAKANRHWGPSAPPVRCSTWVDGRGDIVFSSSVWKPAAEGRAAEMRSGDTVKVPRRMSRFVLHNVLAEMPKADCRVFEWLKERGLLRLKGKASKECLLEKLLLARFGNPEEFLAWLKYNMIPCDVTRASDGPSEEELDEWLFPSKALKKSLAPFATEDPRTADERAALLVADDREEGADLPNPHDERNPPKVGFLEP